MKIINGIAFLLMILLVSCGSSTDTRYGRSDESKEKNDPGETNKTEVSVEEDFDFTPFMTDFDIPEKQNISPNNSAPDDLNIWYEYDDNSFSPSPNKKIVAKVSGYRVLVLTTDSLEEANYMRSEVHFKIPQREVYIIFDPPFYKVMVGDFTELSEAKDLNFRLTQMGYTETRVVNETVNVYGE
jgi:hypothetical protein